MLFATCYNACTSATPSNSALDMTNNGACEDGGEDSVSSVCLLGNDCLDCGPRLTYQSPDPPSPPFAPCVNQELQYFTDQRIATTYCDIRSQSYYQSYKCVVAPGTGAELASASSETFTCYTNAIFTGICVHDLLACPLQDVMDQEHCQQLCSALVDCKAYEYYANNNECYPKMNVGSHTIYEQPGDFFADAVSCVRTWYHDVLGMTLHTSRRMLDMDPVDVTLALAPRAIGDYKDIHTQLSIFDANTRSRRLGEMLRAKSRNSTEDLDPNASVPYVEAKRRNMARQAAMQAYRDRKPHRERMALEHIASNRSRRELRHNELIYCWPDGRQFNDLYEGEEDPVNTYVGYERCGSQPCTPGVDDPQLCQDSAEGYGCEIPTEACCQAQYQLSYTPEEGSHVQFLCSWRYEYERGHTFRWEYEYEGYVNCGMYVEYFDVEDPCTLTFGDKYSFVPDSYNYESQPFDSCPTAQLQMNYCCSEICGLWPVPSNTFFGAPEIYPFQPECAHYYGYPHQWSIDAHQTLSKDWNGNCVTHALSPPPPVFRPADEGLEVAMANGYTFNECPAQPFTASGGPSESCCLQACQMNYYIQSDLCQQYYGDCVVLNDYTGWVDCTAAYWWRPYLVNDLIQCCDEQCDLSYARYGFPIASLGCLEDSAVPACGTRFPSPSPSRPPPSSPPPPPPPPGPRFPPATNVYSARECMLESR